MPVPPPYGSSVSSTLPLDVLEAICRSALDLHDHETAGQQHPRLSPLTLLVLDSSWHLATARVIYEKLVLPDDDELLLLASDAPTDVGSEANRSVGQDRVLKQLLAIAHNDVYADAVKSLQVVPGKPAWREVEMSPNNGPSDYHEARESDLPAEQTPKLELVHPDPLDDFALHIFIRSRLSSLQSSTWSTTRPPPDVVIDAFSRSGELVSFTGWSPLALAVAPAVSGNEHADASAVRWDALCLPFLPMETLSTLTLHNLSYDGIRSLQGVLSSLTACETLVLDNTLFLDDSLLSEMAETMVRLRSLAIRNMAGTKVTNRGITALMEGSAALEELELTEFEGRLTRRCWVEIESYPATFRSLRIAFSEVGSTHHSWTVDHLKSICHFLTTVRGLETFSITRLVPPEAELPLQHERVALAPLLQPKPLPDGLLAALTKHSATLRVVELNFWEISLERTKTLLETCTGLSHFGLMFDAPFGKLLNMTSTFLLLQKLQIFKIHIPPRNTAAIKDVMSAVTAIKSSSDARTVSGYVSTPPVLPTNVDDSGIGLKSPRTRKGSTASLSSLVAVPGLPKDVAPALRDIKKLAKRCGALNRIEWLGRGAAGIWEISRAVSAREPKVTFTPINEIFERRNTASLELAEESSGIQKENEDGSRSMLATSPIVRRTRGITSSSYTSSSSFASYSTSSSTDTTAPRSPLHNLRGSPTSFLRCGMDDLPELSPTFPVTPRGLNAIGKSRSKSVSVGIGGQNRATSPETPVRNRMMKSKSISGIAGLGISGLAGIKEEPEVVKVVHGGGWVSRKAKTSSGSLKLQAPPLPQQQPAGPPTPAQAAVTATPASPSSDAKKNDRHYHRHRGGKNRSKQNLKLDTNAIPAPLTEENLKAVPSTASKVEFPDLSLAMTAKEEKQKVQVGKCEKKEEKEKVKRPGTGMGKNGNKVVGMGKIVENGHLPGKK